MTELLLSVYDDGLHYWTPQRFKDDMHGIWLKLQPYYHRFHNYIRSKFRWYYGEYMKNEMKIPFHLVGNMWGQVNKKCFAIYNCISRIMHKIFEWVR